MMVVDGDVYAVMTLSERKRARESQHVPANDSKSNNILPTDYPLNKRRKN